MANMGPTWVLSGPGGSHVVPMNLAIRVCTCDFQISLVVTAGYEDWKSWTPRCSHVYTAETSMILSEYLSGTSVLLDDRPQNIDYTCEFQIMIPEGEVIVLMWKVFQLKRKTDYVKVRIDSLHHFEVISVSQLFHKWSVYPRMFLWACVYFPVNSFLSWYACSRSHRWPLLLTRVNFNPSMDNKLYPL